jgi:hypothetical protein
MGTDVKIRGRQYSGIEKMPKTRLERMLKDLDADIKTAEKHSTTNKATVEYTDGLKTTRHTVQTVLVQIRDRDY